MRHTAKAVSMKLGMITYEFVKDGTIYICNDEVLPEECNNDTER